MNLHIPSPCSESWADMVPADKGKHCLACDKVVVDFTQMDTEQIKAYFQVPREKKVCGRFLSSQLAVSNERTSHLFGTLQEGLSTFKPSSRLLSLGLGFFTSLLTLVGCKQELQGDKLMGEPSEQQPTAPLKEIDSVETEHIKGKVKVESGKKKKGVSSIREDSVEEYKGMLGEVMIVDSTSK